MISRLAVVLLLLLPLSAPAKDPPTSFECRWADTPIVIELTLDHPQEDFGEILYPVV